MSPQSDDEDALFDALESESDPALAPFRAQRLQQLASELARAKHLRNEGHGTYSEIQDEKALMGIVTSAKWSVVHFFKDGFGRCGVMDGHLETLASSHIETRFLRMNVDHAPFLVTKLKVRVLPCVIAFVDGVGADRIVGFEGLGGGELGNDGDGFRTKDLEARLLTAGVLVGEKTLTQTALNQQRASRKKQEEDDEGDDWD
ncbi:hypothetical protein MMC07_002018 [Pseudocyphellaria aurata]|nr:hypothetical protein [Pseudocyphellaria aurata]